MARDHQRAAWEQLEKDELIRELERLSAASAAPTTAPPESSISATRSSAELDVLCRAFESLPAAAFVKDRIHRYVFVNQAFSSLTGLDRERCVGYTEAEILGSGPPNSDERVFTEGSHVFEKPFGDAFDAPILRIHVRAFRDASGREFSAGFVRDATREREYELGAHAAKLEGERRVRDGSREIEATRARLRQSQKLEALGQLAGGVAHDFNNLLAVMTANLELSLRRLDERHDVAPEIERALVAAERAASLTHRLLAFSRRQALRPWPIDVNEIVENSVDLLERTLGETIRVEIVLEEALPPTLVDPLELETALINLAINARDAMPAGGNLTLKTALARLAKDSLAGRVAAPGDYVLLQVVDDGVGIPADDVSRVFEPFFTTKAVGKGSGLGLSMVRSFVESARGHVELESRPGQGTEVSLYLPVYQGLRPAPRVSARVRRKVSTRPPAGAPLVLVVEDDAEFARVAVQMCESLGFGAESAGDAEQALEKLPRLPHVRVVLTDVVLPKLSGPDFIERLQSFRPDLMVAWMSGYAVDDVSDRFRTNENVHVLTKPFRRADLARLLGALLDHDDSTSE